MSKMQAPPLVTFALFTYNQERFVREAVIAALNQEYTKLEIIFSDDYSTDSTFEMISSVVSNYSGPHKIITNKNTVNLGLAKHFNEIVGRSQGKIIVVAAGDDISLPSRVSKTVEILSSNPETNIVSFSDIVIDEDGKEFRRARKKKTKKVRKVTLNDYLTGYAPHLSGASRGFNKKIFDIFGGLNDECPTEDTPYILRGLMIGNALVSSECGILYRKHGSNLSGPSSLHAMKFEEIKKQYLKDAKYAFSIGLITNKSTRKICNWAEKNYRRRKVSKDFHYDPWRLKFFLLRVIPDKDFKFREKIGMLLNIFRT